MRRYVLDWMCIRTLSPIVTTELLKADWMLHWFYLNSFEAPINWIWRDNQLNLLLVVDIDYLNRLRRLKTRMKTKKQKNKSKKKINRINETNNELEWLSMYPLLNALNWDGEGWFLVADGLFDVDHLFAAGERFLSGRCGLLARVLPVFHRKNQRTHAMGAPGPRARNETEHLPAAASAMAPDLHIVHPPRPVRSLLWSQLG